MKPVQKLLEYDRTIITEIELQQMLAETDYLAFCRIIEKLVDNGIVAPVKTAGINGKLPPLANKYRIIKPREDYSGYYKFIRRLNPRLNISGYLKRPELYKKHQIIVEGLSGYLWYTAELLVEPMSRKERSFSIWGSEKFLDDHFTLIREVLRFNNLREDFLNFYNTPEPFFEYVHSRSGQMTVLALENKDTWFTFRKLMLDTGKNVIAGTPVDMLLYGEGNKISKPGALEEFNATMLGKRGPSGRFLYFGDLDPEGIRLFFRTREANPSLDIRPFISLYQLMLQLAKGRELPESPDKRGVKAPLAEFAFMLGFDKADALTAFLEKGLYIPQEIVNYQVVSEILS